jgi:hypothetical protein
MNHRVQMRQASSFLIRALLCYDNQDDTITIMKDYLFQQVAREREQIAQDREGILEPDFEKSEILIALLHVCKTAQEKAMLSQLYSDMKNMIGSQEKDRIENVFALNWHAQFVYHVHKTGFKERSEVAAYAQIIYDEMITVFPKDATMIGDMETNYTAVFFEGLCHLYGFLPSDQSDIKHKLGLLFSGLMVKYDNGLFCFQNGDARLDITGHILSGLRALN